MSHRYLLRVGFAAIGVLSFLAPDFALAQGEIEEVVVMARRRNESAQSVPISITAIGSNELKKRDIISAQDLQHAVPGLTLTTGTGRDSAAVNMRGINTTYTGIGNNPGVIVYFAEVPVPSGGLAVGEYMDLETVSVLKGPQGTLFGRNATGGAILLQPNKPTNDFGGYVEGTVGDYNRHDATGAVNLPLVKDKLLLRIAGTIGHRDGYTKDINTGRDYDNRDFWAIRGSLLWRPTDRIENLLVGRGSNSSSNGQGNVPEVFNPGGSGGFPGLLYPNLASVLAAQKARGPRLVAHDVPGESTELRIAGGQDRLSIELSPEISLINIASYYELRQRWNNGIDLDGSINPMYLSTNVYPETRTFPASPNGSRPPQEQPAGGWFTAQNIVTEELQLQGKARHDKLIYTIGAYYQNSQPDSWVIQTTQAFAPIGTTLPNRANFTRSEASSKAVYAQATYDLGDLVSALDGLKFTAGYRQTWDEVNQSGASYLLPGIPPGGGVPSAFGNCSYGAQAGPGNYNCQTNGRATFDHGTYTLGLDYKLAPDQLIYFAHRHGYKAGGFNNTAPPELRSFFPETVTDYEVGYKGDWHAGSWKFRTNIDAYYARYKNIQQIQSFFSSIYGTVIAPVLNGSTAQIYGVDVEATVIPAKWIEISGFYNHVDGHYDHFFDTNQNPVNKQGTGQIPCVGTLVCASSYHGEIPGNPEHKASVSVQLNAPIPDTMGQLSLTTYYTYQSHYWTSNPQGNPGIANRAYSLVNMNLDWVHIAGSPVSGSLFVTNLTDKVYSTGSFDGWGLGFISYQYGEPRMFGGRIKYEFGN